MSHGEFRLCNLYNYYNYLYNLYTYISQREVNN